MCIRDRLQEVISRTVKLVAKWQAVGFTHGVLNTDNMSILGETIDYGPFGFIERFDPNFTPNTTDFAGRRYAFRNQPQVAQWNLMALATSLVTVGLVEKVTPALVVFDCSHTCSAAHIFYCERNAHMPALSLHLVSDQLHIGTAAAAIAATAVAIRPVLLTYHLHSP